MNKLFLITTVVFLLNINANADNTFDEGKELFRLNCNNCHHGNVTPPIVPPMFVIQSEYKKVAPDPDAFVEQMASYVARPTQEKALIKDIANTFGLMPILTFPHETTRKIALYIYNESFKVPCGYWKRTVEQAKESGNKEQLENDSKKLDELCRN